MKPSPAIRALAKIAQLFLTITVLALLFAPQHTQPALASQGQRVEMKSPSPDVESWGEPVQGVQLRLMMPGNSEPGPFPPVGLPALKIQIHNGGSAPVRFSWDWLSCGSAIEVDDVWYNAGSCAGNGASGPPLVPGASSEKVSLNFQSLTTDGKTLIAPNGLNLRAGKHTVRVKTPMSSGIEDSRGQTLVLVSNPVTFEVGPNSRVTSAISMTDAGMFAGTWRQDIAKSKYHLGHTPTSPTVMKVVAAPNGLTVVADGLTESGQNVHKEYSVRFDGASYPYHEVVTPHYGSSDANFVVSATKIDDQQYEIILKQAGNGLGTIERHVLSKDGKSQTVTITGEVAGRSYEDTIVFEKQ